jgi:hypothetical protein
MLLLLLLTPSITNLTLVGPGSAPLTVLTWLENDAIKLRRGTRSFTNVFLSNWKVGFNVENDETIALSLLVLAKVTKLHY